MRVVSTFALGASIAIGPSALAADARTDATAQDVLTKVANDYLAMDYGRAAAQLDHALRMCGANRCAPATKAALWRDLGTMQFRMGDGDLALRSFGTALGLKPDLALNPDYDASDLRAVWANAQRAAATPSGELDHTAPAQQRTGTPLPLYVEGGGEGIARVVVKYQRAGAKDWKELDLERVGAGWGGLVPCGDVQAGTLRYYVQGFAAGHDPAAASGDAKRPYVVSIRDDVPGDVLHLPGAKPPASCAPGPLEAALGGGTDRAPSERSVSGPDDEPVFAKPSEGPARATGPRIWLGGAMSIELMAPPAGDNLCRLDPSTARPANTANIYCVGADGSDFPARNDGGAQNGALVAGQAGHSSGNVVAGGLRLMVALDVAFGGSWLVGLRVGGVFGEYPGQLALRDGVAPGLSYHLEGRISWVIGDRAVERVGVAPVVFVGAGVSEFDEHASSTVAVGAYRDATGRHPATSHAVDLWLTNGPEFVAVGGGLRYAPFRRLAVTALLKATESFGKNGLIPAVGPELTVQYGLW